MKEKVFTRNFTLLLLGQIFSLLGNGALRFALSMYVLEKTGSAAVFGTLLAVSMVPTILLTPFGGVLADRMDRRAIMVGLDLTSGAAVLAATAAARSGVGYVRLASTSRVCKLVAARCPEVIYTICEKDERGGIAGESLAAILEAARGADAVAIGCGMEPGPDTLAIVKGLLAQQKPLLLDAGALTALARHPDPLSLLKNAACPVTVTPHPGEYARLAGMDAGAVGNNPFSGEYTMAKDAGVTVLLKGPVTSVTGPAGGRRYHFGGCDGLAKGGSGDVHTGVIGGLLARGAAPETAALCGGWLHGEAARLCARDWSRDGMLPSQLPEYIAKAFLEAERETG